MRLINVGLRGSTLLAKFLLIFVLAYYLEPVDVALYGLLAASISFGVYCVGFDFYTFSSRELIAAPKISWLRLLRDQGAFFLLVYLIAFPLMLAVFYFDFLPWILAPWFFTILLLEHLGQELNRLLVAMSRQLLASVVLFLRAGLWAFVVVAAFWWSEEARSLHMVLACWALGGLLAMLLGLLALKALDREALALSVDWAWIGRGIKVALPLLLATLALRGMFTFDRYWLQSAAGTDVLAAYVIFIGVGNALVSFLDASVFVFLYPSLVKAYQQKNRNLFFKNMKSMLLQTMMVMCVLVLVAVVAIRPVLVFLDNEVYSQYMDVYYLVLLAMFLLVLSMVPHYGLYAMKLDRWIISAHLLTFFLFLVLSSVLMVFFPIHGIPLSLVVSFAIMLVYKGVAYMLADKTSLQ